MPVHVSVDERSGYPRKKGGYDNLDDGEKHRVIVLRPLRDEDYLQGVAEAADKRENVAFVHGEVAFERQKSYSGYGKQCGYYAENIRAAFYKNPVQERHKDDVDGREKRVFASRCVVAAYRLERVCKEKKHADSNAVDELIFFDAEKFFDEHERHYDAGNCEAERHHVDWRNVVE